MKAAHLCGRVRGRGVWGGIRTFSLNTSSLSGGPPVPRILVGSCVLCGAARLLATSSRKVGGVEIPLSRPGVVMPLGRGVASESWMLVALVSARGMASCSFPISSARSVIALFEEPSMSWRPRASHAVAAKTAKNPITGGVRKCSKFGGGAY